MSTTPGDLADVQHGWQQPVKEPRRFRIGLYAWRLLIALLFLAAIGCFVALILWWLSQPRTHLLVFSTRGLPALQGPAAPVAGRELELLRELEPAVVYPGPEDVTASLISPSAVGHLPQNLNKLNIGDDDALVVYVAAQGATRDDGAYMICDNFNAANVSEGLISVDELLRPLKSATAKTKLLILDAGRFGIDPRLGLISDDFYGKLKKAVQLTGDGHLWVLVSHADRQQSHRSSALGGSVFGTFVAKGLLGAADVNGNGEVDLGELVQFVTPQVSSWVEQTTKGGAEQTPRLIHGISADMAGTADEQAPRVVTVDKLAPELRSIAIDNLIARRSDEPRSVSGRTELAGIRPLLDSIATPPDQVAQPGGPMPVGPPTAQAASGGAGGDGKTSASSEGEAEEDEATKTAKENIEAARQFRSLLDAAWRTRDMLADNPGDDATRRLRPVDSTPHLWREMQEELVAYETAYRESWPLADTSAAELLKTALAQFWSIEDGMPVLRRDLMQVSGSAKRTDATLRAVDGDAVRSISVARLLEGEIPSLGSLNIEESDQLLDGLIEAYPDELPQRLEELQLTPGMARFYELRLIQQLKEVGGVPPALFQLALQVRRDGERVAASELWIGDWLENQVVAGDRLRLAGERYLLDQIGANWPEQARGFLEQARRQYAAADQISQDVWRAVQLRNELVFRAPYYVRASRAAPSTDAQQPIARFLTDLATLATLLDDPAAAGPDRNVQLRQLLTDLPIQEHRISRQFGDQSILRLVSRPRAGDAWRVDELLETPLPSAFARRGLLAASRDVDAALVIDFEPPSGAASDAEYGSDEMGRQIGRCGLALKLAELAAWDEERNARQDRASRALATCQAKFRDLEAGAQTLSTAQDSSNSWASVHGFYSALSDFYRALPQRVQLAGGSPAPPQHDEVHRQAIRGQRALRQLDSRDAGSFRNVDLASQSRIADVHDLLAWQERRMRRAGIDMPESELSYLNLAADDYRTGATKLLKPATTAPSAADAEIGAPEVVSLVIRPQRDATITATFRGAGVADAWVVLQFDPELVELSVPENVYREHELSKQISRALAAANSGAAREISGAEQQLAVQYPYRPDLAGLAPTWTNLQSGEPQSLSLEFRPKAQGVDSAHVIAKVITRARAVDSGSGTMTATTTAPFAGSVSYVRRSIAVPLRVADLVVEGPPNSWRPVGRQLVLHTYPNRVTNYDFGIVNYGPTDREFNLRFFAPATDLPWTTLSQNEIEKHLSRLTAVGELTIAAPADGEPHFAIAGSEEEPLAASEAVAPVTPEAAEESAEPPTGPPLQHGLLVEVSDPQDPLQKFVQRIEIVPQRPRRYVRPHVSYNSRLQRIEVTVTPRLSSLLPPGPVKIECQIAEDPVATTGGKLSDVVAAPDYEAQMFVNLSAPPPQEVTLYLHVDGYPRAFVYRVPCGPHAVDLPEEMALDEVRLRNVAWQEYQPQTPVTSIEAQVDSPVGMFETGGDTLRVALDENMDQRLGPEPGMRRPTDRQVGTYLHALGEDGVLSVDTRVADHQIPLLTNRLQNIRVQVNGRVTAGGRESDAAPLSLNIDGAPPKVQYADVMPWGGFVVSGEPLQVTVLASDTMSGVKVVEVGFDVDGTGEFSPKAAPIAAVLDPSDYSVDPRNNSLSATPPSLGGQLAGLEPRHWIATVPTDQILGVQTLLIRATDHVGNASGYYSKRVQVVTPEQAAAKVQQQPKLVEGTVIFRDGPVPGAVLVLADPDANEVASAMAGADGKFSLGAVPPGKYALNAEGVINNVPRFGSQMVIIELTPGQVIQADVRVE
jgi:hypothetical protein